MCSGKTLVHDVAKLSSVDAVTTFTCFLELYECLLYLLLAEVGVLPQQLHVKAVGGAGGGVVGCIVPHLMVDI